MDTKNINIVFVIPEKAKDENECSGDMHQAYEICKQNSFDVKWIREENYENIKTHKTSILVFQSFEGRCFNSVKDSKAAIVGPWCLLTCIVEGLSVPNLPWPILNIAMLNCVVASSNLSKDVKQELKYKIQCMGGQYTDALMAHNTHLITNSVKSQKYVKAAEAKVKVMLSSWVEEVWIASQKANVHADDKEFNKHVCLPFHNLQICSTGFKDIKERKELERLVTENGATYSGQLYVGKTDVLICKNATSSEKYKVARKTNHIQCVTYEWIVDSLKNGYALPETAYCVRKGTSTPKKDEEAADPNFSTISAISSASMLMPNRYVVEETINLTSLPSENITRKRKSSDGELNEIIDGIDIKAVKQAGTFLDGCSIYLIGFTPEQKEKLCKVLNFSGATRYEELSERVTHVIVGDSSCHEYKLLISKGLQSPSVNINWLTDSLKNKQPMSEESYLVELSSPNSDSGPPLSKKNVLLSRTRSSENEIPSKLFEDHFGEADGEVDLIQQYLKGKSNSQEDTLAQFLKNNTGIDNNIPKIETVNPREETTNTYTASMDETEQNLIFEGLKILILNFDKNEYNELKECIESVGGETVQESAEDIPDFVVVPVYKIEQPVQTTAKIVTDYWITECIRENELRKILYYHQPCPIEKTDVLRGCVITISSYAQCERAFLINLIQYLGAISQEQLARVGKGEILATTHLLSCEASGKKYAAAIKWKIPVIDKDWLLECARTRTFVSAKKYLIGDATHLDPQESVQSTSSTLTKQIISTSTALEQGSTLAEISEALKSKNSGTPVKHTHMTSSKKSNVLASLTSQEIDGINQASPKFNKLGSKANVEVKTPVNRMLKKVKAAEMNTPMSPPVNKIVQQFRTWHGDGSTPVTPKLKGDLDDVNTPDTPYGAFIRPNPSPHLRKVMLKWINDAPDHRPRRDSTPLSELKRQLWNNICQPKEVQDENKAPTQNNETYIEDDEIHQEKSTEEVENVIVNNLQQLQEMLTASGGNRKSMKKRLSTLPAEASTSALKDSQPCTVGWDYMDSNEVEQVNDPKKKQNFIFIISGVDLDEKEHMSNQLQSLGAVVSELTNYDPNCTHLISVKVGRNEKLMSAMAGGKWILHPSYVTESVAAGRLLDEEEFEYGNPKAAKNVNNSFDRGAEAKLEVIHWWRKEINRRGYGAFHDMRAIIVATKRDPLVKIIEAGGGMVIDASPPYNESVFATHCILQVKIIPDLSAYIPLAKQGIYCVDISYINNFLHRTVKDIRDCILPYFSQYYNQD